MRGGNETSFRVVKPRPDADPKEFLDYDAYRRHRLINQKFKDQQLTAHGLPPDMLSIFVEGARFLQIHDWVVHMLKK
jgi:hypothetical protein